MAQVLFNTPNQVQEGLLCLIHITFWVCRLMPRRASASAVQMMEHQTQIQPEPSMLRLNAAAPWSNRAAAPMRTSEQALKDAGMD
jgi:hypothetical protein